jgi:hypothetical protein
MLFKYWTQFLMRRTKDQTSSKKDTPQTPVQEKLQGRENNLLGNHKKTAWMSFQLSWQA